LINYVLFVLKQKNQKFKTWNLKAKNLKIILKFPNLRELTVSPSIQNLSRASNSGNFLTDYF